MFRRSNEPTPQQLDDERDMTLIAHRDAHDFTHGYNSAEFVEVISEGIGAAMEAKINGTYPPKGHGYPRG